MIAEKKYQLACVHHSCGCLISAWSQYSEAINHDPLMIEAYNNRACVLALLGQISACYSDLSRGLLILGNANLVRYPQLAYNRGIVSLALGNIDAALRDFGRIEAPVIRRSNLNLNLGNLLPIKAKSRTDYYCPKVA